ncbi:Arc family DNA-binding protein [Shinella sp. PSBB067]|uniref:Arc family DNA-binding protein n=1 Tax=Shinella sp. PSBB067 TaxID=2715959 RepID=UPI00193C45D3|nr:Arc family DNA-binding protein [Shinella sp. PSBB067]QRI61833.1 Arc family DNA-binding protein [Shinella sp. PSBB067]
MAKRALVKDQYKLLIRLSDDLRDKIVQSAEANDRSLNAEVVSRLESSFATKGTLKEKLEAIAAGRFVPEPASLDIFDDGGFDALSLQKVLRELATEVALLRNEIRTGRSNMRPKDTQ